MGLDEDASHPDRDRRARQHWNEFPLAAGGRPLPARLLHGMRGVEDHRRAGGAREDRQRAHVGDEGIVTEGRPTLGHQHVGIAGRGNLGDDVRHVPRRQELSLLDVDDASGRGGGEEEIGLPTQKGGNLQHVHDFSNARALLCLVHVGEDGHAERLADFRKDWQSAIEADAAVAPRAGTVGLVERGFVDEADPELAGDLLERRGHFERVVAALERARPRDQRERQPIAEARFADGDDRIGSGLDIHRGRPCAGRL